MRYYRSALAYTCLFAGMTGLSTKAQAAEMDQHVCDNQLACIEQQYEEKKYDPIDFAALKLIVGGQEAITYEDNIFRSSNNEESDIVNRFSPRVALESNLDRHYWGMELKAENGVYFSNSENNYTDFSALASGRYDANEEVTLSAQGGYVLDHVGIGSFVEDPNVRNEEPTPFHTVLAHAALDYLPQANPLHVNAAVGVDNINYENVGRQGGGTDIQDDRDRIEYSGALQVGYRMYPTSEVYAKLVDEEWRHDERIDSSALASRDSAQHRYLVGYRNAGDNQALSYDVAVGYLEQNYDASRWPDVQTLDVYANAQWKIDPANKLRLLITRDVHDAYSSVRSAYLQSRARINYEHDYNDALSLGVGYSFTKNEFESLPAAPIDREDDIHGVHLWGAYEFYKDFEASLFYTYTNRNSNDPLADYNANVIGFALSYKR